MSKKEAMVRPGDIILVKTPNVFYDAMRKLYATEYDHVIVVVDQERCLHITYPKAKLAPLLPFLQKKRDPLVVRVNDSAMNYTDRQNFISNVKHASVGQKYDSTKLMQYFRLSMLDKMGVQASYFGSTIVQKVRNLGLKMPETKEKDIENQGVIVLEAKK